MEPITRGWKFVHIGFEDDAVEVGGLNPWKLEWVPRHDRITAEHPFYPAERHTMWTYEVLGVNGPVVFPAGEFSNGVWDIFVPE